MKTVFSVNGQGYAGDGVGRAHSTNTIPTGNDAVDAIMAQFPNARVILKGFVLKDENVLVKPDLTTKNPVLNRIKKGVQS